MRAHHDAEEESEFDKFEHECFSKMLSGKALATKPDRAFLMKKYSVL